jgi:hypothetical protein
MQHRLSSMVLIVAVSMGATPSHAQMWFDTAAVMQPVVLNPCPGGRCPDLSVNAGTHDDGNAGSPSPGPTSTGASGVNLTYSTSAERRRANLASFVAKTRAGNPASADQMERLFASTDVIEQIGAAVSPYGYSVTDVGDAYACWWMMAWEGAQGSNRTPPPHEMKAVQSQAHRALAADPNIARASDARKQVMAEALWIQAAMIDSMVDLAKEQPELMPKLRQAIRKGAKASGVDLDAMQLTPTGFVGR